MRSPHDAPSRRVHDHFGHLPRQPFGARIGLRDDVAAPHIRSRRDCVARAVERGLAGNMPHCDARVILLQKGEYSHVRSLI